MTPSPRKLLRTILHLRTPSAPVPPPTPLTNLPNELLLLIAEQLPPAPLASLLRCSHHLYHLLTPLLHKHVLYNWTPATRHPDTLYVSSPPILYAAFLGYTGLARIVLSRPDIPAQLDARCPRGSTALHWATRRGDGDMVRLLLRGGAAVDAVDENFGETALHAAAQLGNEGVMRLLVAYGAEVDQLSFARVTPLVGAVKRVQVGAVRLLLEKGAAVPVADRRGETPLHWAAEYGSVEMVRVLVGWEGFEVGVRSATGKTPLHLAVVRTRGAEEVAGVLLRAGADVNVVDGLRRSVLWWALSELLREYRYKGSKALDRRKREAVVKLVFEQNPRMGKMEMKLLHECKKAVGLFSRFWMHLEAALATHAANNEGRRRRVSGGEHGVCEVVE